MTDSMLKKGGGKLSRRRARLLSAGNDKVGAEIFTFNLPPLLSCPGASEACVHECYAMKHRWRFANVRASLLRNWEAAHDPFFAERMIHEIRRRQAKVVRMHASGDDADATYIRRWGRIIDACRATTFYA